MARKVTAPDANPTEPDWQSWPELPLSPILAASLVHFQEHGYHGTTVRNIAAGADLTMPTLYYHYGNKEGLLFALLEIAVDDLDVHVARCLEDAGGDPLKRFENFITTIALHYTHRRDLAMLHAEFRFLGGDFRARYVERRTAFDKTLEELLKDGIAAGIFDSAQDPHFSARLLQGMLGGILNWYRDAGPLSAAEIARRYTSYAVRAVSTSEQGGPPQLRAASGGAKKATARKRQTS